MRKKNKSKTTVTEQLYDAAGGPYTAHVMQQPVTIQDIVDLAINGGFSPEQEHEIAIKIMLNKGYGIYEPSKEKPKTLLDKIKAFF